MATVEEILNSKGQSLESAKPEETPAPVQAPAEATTTDTTGVQAEGDGRPRDEQGRFRPKESEAEKPKDAKPKSQPPGDSQKPVTEGQLAALMAEREKRQALERQLAEMQKRIPQQQVKKPDLYEAPDEFRADIHRSVTETVLNERLNMSEMMVRSQFDDAEDAINTFMEAVQANPALRSQAMQSAHPYKYIYDEGKRILAMKEIGDPISYRERLEKEIREKVMAELQQANPSQPAATLNLPTSLGSVRSAGPRTGPGWGGPKPLNQILGNR